MKQHPFAVVDAGAEIDDDVEIGPFCVVHAGARIGSGTVLKSHVVVHGCASIGRNNRFHQGCSIGDDPQDISVDATPTFVEIGDNNVFREGFTIHRGTGKDRKLTSIGDNGYFMAYSHVAHDCVVGDNVIMTNQANISGHVRIEDFVIIGAYTGVHQFCRVGAHAFLGPSTVVLKDVVPYAMAYGNRARIFGLNLVGLRRRGFSRETLQQLKSAFRLLFHSSLNTTQAVERIEAEIVGCAEVDRLVGFVKTAKRGIVKRDKDADDE